MRKLIGGGNIVRSRVKRMKSVPKTSPQVPSAMASGALFDPATHVINIFLDPPQYTVMENVGTMKVKVSKTGTGWLGVKLDVLVDYSVNGTLRFTPADQCFYIDIPIIDDDIFEEDEHFYVLLENLRVLDESTGRFIKNSTSTFPDLERQLTKELPLSQILSPNRATVVILDDDHAGVFSIEHEEYIVPENSGVVNITVKRSSGARGLVAVPYATLDGTAVAGKDYTKTSGILEFENNETEKTIEIGIINKEEYERYEIFSLFLSTPICDESTRDDSLSSRDRKTKEIAEKGRPKLGRISKCRIKIQESKEFKGLVDKMMKKANVSDAVGTHSWKEQFNDAFTVRSSEEDANVDLEEDNLPSCCDYVMHFISVPWKVLAACCPPTEYYNGWACFVVTIFLVGLFTAMIGDLANHFGCTIGLKDTVTAISLVAMGTSVPDLFASKVAAVQDKYADSSIGNVTGSNAVNVFLGIGLAWCLCAIVSWLRSEEDGFRLKAIEKVEPGSLAFSVTLFCTEAVICISIIILRRHKCFGGGELGGSWKNKITTAVIFLGMWATYVILSTLETYCVISGF
uniref:Calx-beta domain-containing protein n=1 Tax=Romanomermis culicivorax TaxID=13658 RepID=A0A915IAL6_ROMCU